MEPGLFACLSPARWIRLGLILTQLCVMTSQRFLDIFDNTPCTQEDIQKRVKCLLVMMTERDSLRKCTLPCAHFNQVVTCVNKEVLTAACVQYVPTITDNLAGNGRCNYEKLKKSCPHASRLIIPEWSSWSEYGHCSRSCAPGGVRVRRRKCVSRDDNTLEHGGCAGNSSQAQTCNTQDCSLTSSATASSRHCLVFLLSGLLIWHTTHAHT